MGRRAFREKKHPGEMFYRDWNKEAVTITARKKSNAIVITVMHV